MAQCVSECHASSHFKLSFIFISIYFCFLLQLCLHTKIQREKKNVDYAHKKKSGKKRKQNFFTLAQTEISARRRLRLPFPPPPSPELRNPLREDFYLFFIFTFYYSYISKIFLFTKRSPCCCCCCCCFYGCCRIFGSAK